MKPIPQLPQNKRAKVVGIWIRVSTEDQARGESPEVHEKRARMYAEAREWDVREVYRLEAVSGKSVMGHPEAQRMLADIRSGHISGLVFSKLARLARNTKELLDFADAFRDANADMISLQEAIDTGTPAGRFFFTLLSAMAQWEREEIAERIAASVPIRARMGRQIGGKAQFGYQWKDKRLVPDPKEAPVRALMYELFLEHRRVKTVARILNDRGYRTRDGKPFIAVSLKRLLTDPAAKGILRQNYTRSQGHGRNWEFKPREEWVETPVEAVVSAEVWDQVNALLENRRVNGNAPARRSPHLFAGYAVCQCGGKMYVWSNSPKYVCKKCRNKIPIADLEAVYRDRLSQFALSPDEIEGHRAAADEAMREKEALVRAAEAELKKIEAEDERLYQLYLGGGLTPPDFARRQKPLSERRTQLEGELPRLQAAYDVLRIDSHSTVVAQESAADLASRWDRCSVEEKRQFVEAITERIIVGKEDVTISLLCLPHSPHHEGNTSLKMREEHVVPLSRQAIALLHELHEVTGSHKYLFPNRRRAHACITATTINRALERMGFLGKGTIGFSGHGFRATASTMLNEAGFRPDVIERQLAHQERNQVRASYNRATYLPERRAMMQKWADIIDQIMVQEDQKAA